VENRNTWEIYSPEQSSECEDFSKGYIDFLSDAKTERECVDIIVREAKTAGYKDLDELIRKGYVLTENSELDKQAYAINNSIKDNDIRNLDIMISV
jgi:aspartyl aminopeptidase